MLVAWESYPPSPVRLFLSLSPPPAPAWAAWELMCDGVQEMGGRTCGGDSVLLFLCKSHSDAWPPGLCEPASTCYAGV